MARAMVLDPELLLYDEPFSGLDPISLGVVLRLIRLNNDALGLTSIVVSHDVAEISHIADHCFVISEGRVIASGRAAGAGRKPVRAGAPVHDGRRGRPGAVSLPGP